MEPVIAIPSRILEIKQGPEIEGLQDLTTLVLEFEKGITMELVLPSYLFAQLGVETAEERQLLGPR